MKLRFVSLFLCLVLAVLPVFADEPVVIGQKYALQSEILGEERAFFVHLPASYDDETYQPKRYPVLYILDGEGHFLSATGVIDHMSTGFNGNIQIPELIVVAIPNTTDRMRDLTPNQALTGADGKKNDTFATSGGGDAFLQFVEKELIPEIESNYRTLPHRTFVGHSLGGLMMMHSLFTQPGLFQNYIAIDSSLWWDNEIMNRRVQDFIMRDNIKARIYMSIAGHNTTGAFGESGANMLVGNMRFAEWLKKTESPGLKLKVQHFPAEDHGSVPLLSLYHGLLHGFEGYKPDLETYLAGASALSDHFAAFSENVGIEFLPPEPTIDLMANALVPWLEPKAIQGLLELNVSNYPDSAHAKDRLVEFLDKRAQASEKSL